MIGDKQIPIRFKRVIDTQLSIYNSKQRIVDSKYIPSIDSIPQKDKPIWYRIPNAICVYTDMLGSTKLSMELRKSTVARAYHWYVSTALGIFNGFKPEYMNVHGDGVFAIFNGDNRYTALAAAITFKTYSQELFAPTLKTMNRTVGTHIGIDQHDVLLGELGLKSAKVKSIRQNEVWAGTIVNMAAKLAKLAKNDQIHISDRYYLGLKDKLALKYCNCLGNQDIWGKKDMRERPDLDFDFVYSSKIIWCKEHGADRCDKMLQLDIR